MQVCRAQASVSAALSFWASMKRDLIPSLRDSVGFKGCFTPKALPSRLFSCQTVSKETAEGDSDARRGSARPASVTWAFNLSSEEWPLARKQEPHSSKPVFPWTALRHHA